MSKSRRIKSPLLTLPVNVVPNLDENSGHIHNPWSGRRYMILSAQLDERTKNTTALHELFHHYQTGYVWLDRNGHLPLEFGHFQRRRRVQARHLVRLQGVGNLDFQHQTSLL